MERRKEESLSKQMKTKVTNEEKQIEKPEYDGDFGTVISTGSTLLDLAISGGRIRGGGLPGGILVECFGPSSSGKSVLLSEIAGNVQKQKGEIMFHDPEASLDTQFALMFGLSINKDKNYSRPDTVTEVFDTVRKWKPSNEKLINGIFTDSLAALSTTMEMENDEGDPFGGRRAKEFSEGLRKTCRIIKDKNYLMVCSNQVREVIGATMYQAKTKTPGGKALEFYPSLRLEFSSPRKIKLEKQIVGKKQERIIGVETTINVFKSKIWKPFRSATVSIIFNYGLDTIKDNLQYIKDNTENTTYTLKGEKLSNELYKAIKIIEDSNAENDLREEVINLWEEIEEKFVQERKSKR
jgi:recombination protein RecA